MSAWPHQDLPGAGTLDEHELDAACWRKRPVVLTREQIDGADSMADWAQPAPAEACSELLADADAPGFTFPLESILTRHPWLGPVLVTVVVIVWTCLDAFLESTP